VSWYDSDWKYRAPITVYNDAATGTYDWTAAIPSTFQHLFSNTVSAGEDIRITDADGTTPVTFDVASFSQANLTGTIEADNDPLQGTGYVNLRWIYYGYASATTAITAVAPASAKTGTLSMETPSGYVMRAGPEQPGATKPAFKVAKKSTESIDVYIDLTDVLVLRAETSQGSRAFEEPDYMVVTGRTANGTDSSIQSASAHRFLLTPDGRLYAVVRLIAGTAGSDYTVIATITTTLSPTPRVLDYRIWLQIRDVDED